MTLCRFCPYKTDDLASRSAVAAFYRHVVDEHVDEVIDLGFKQATMPRGLVWLSHDNPDPRIALSND